MRHVSLLLAAALATFFSGIGTAQAIPAKPGPVKVTQSDGTQLTVRIYGDEFYHYTLSEEGYALTSGADGDYYFATLDTRGQLVSTGIKAKPVKMLTASDRQKIGTLKKGVRPAMTMRQKQMRAAASGHTAVPTAQKGGMTPPEKLDGTRFNPSGKQKGLIILVEFSDLKFTTPSPQAAFTRLLNEDGYNENGATGSAWNYYYDNSNGRFDPEFTVVGPYTLSHPRKYYYPGSSDLAAVQLQLIPEACRLADADVDFSQFAEEGTIRDIFVFYAGGNEADGSDPNGIWPHRSSVYFGNFFDGAELNGYACSSELSSYSDGIKMAAIGTFCHEFGHVLGWQDFYDTDYTASGGNTSALDYFSLMCTGCYNNDSRTPPSLNILERWMAGWAEPEVLTAGGNYTLEPAWKDKGYLVHTETDNDYFLLEARGAGSFKWDNYIPKNNYYNAAPEKSRGMLVYHVDYTSSSKNAWNNNILNCNPAHECLKLVRSTPGNASAYIPVRTYFPGTDGITQLSATTNKDYISWNNDEPGFIVSGIRLDGENILLTAQPKFVLKVDVLANQYDALLTWNGDAAAVWKVTWESGQTHREATVKGSNVFHITGLTPATTYKVSVTDTGTTAVNGKPLTFDTEPVDAGKSVHIAVPAEGYAHDIPALLSVRDYPGPVSRIDWYIDGRKTQNTYTTLAAGDHHLTAVITDAGDQSQQYIVKYITVK